MFYAMKMFTVQIQTIIQGEARDSCTVDDASTASCVGTDGNLYRVKHGKTVPVHTVCYMKDHSSDERQFICLENGLMVEEPIGNRKGKLIW